MTRRPRNRMTHLLAALAYATCGAWAWAGGGPQNLALLVNADSWVSKAVANEYIRRRGVPAANVVYLERLPSFESLDVDALRRLILLPTQQILQQRGVAEHIHYLIYAPDFPTAVDVRADVGSRKLPKMFGGPAAITGLTFLYPLVLQHNIGYLQLNVNDYYRAPDLPNQDAAPWSSDDIDAYARGIQAMAKRDLAEADRLLTELLLRHSHASELLYNLACCKARAGQAEAAVSLLERAFDCGWYNIQHVRQDRDLESLRAREDFRDLLQRMETRVFATQPSSAYPPAPDPDAKRPPLPHLLSTMLAVTSGRGLSPREALAAVRRNVAADGTRPPGTVYYMRSGDVRSRTRAWGFAAAVELLRREGVAAEILSGDIPRDRTDIIGLQAGVAKFSWPKSSHILPGAICEHLTSWGGALQNVPWQTPLTAFLRHGAAGASGTVTEPFAIQAKFPTAFLHVHYARGCSLAEAFYQSVAGPYQLLIVGDPLCAPWARRPGFSLSGLESGQQIHGLRLIRPAAGAGPQPARFDLFVDGHFVHQCRPGQWLAVRSRELPDGYHTLRVVATTADAVAVQAEETLPFVVANYGPAPTASIDRQRVTLWDSPVRVSAALPGAERLELWHNGRLLRTLDGDAGSMPVAPALLGLGQTTLRVVAITGSHSAYGPPLEIEVVAPDPLPARPPAGPEAPAPGLRLQHGEQQAAAVDDAAKPGWLKRGGVTNGEAWRLLALFDAAGTDLYQLQIRSSMAVTVTADERQLSVTEPGRWNYIPAPLAAGRHRLQLTGRGDQGLQLDVRFGARGTRPLTDAGCRAPVY